MFLKKKTVKTVWRLFSVKHLLQIIIFFAGGKLLTSCCYNFGKCNATLVQTHFTSLNEVIKISNLYLMCIYKMKTLSFLLGGGVTHELLRNY